jgi:hypothetical protein
MWKGRHDNFEEPGGLSAIGSLILHTALSIYTGKCLAHQKNSTNKAPLIFEFTKISLLLLSNTASPEVTAHAKADLGPERHTPSADRDFLRDRYLSEFQQSKQYASDRSTIATQFRSVY